MAYRINGGGAVPQAHSKIDLAVVVQEAFVDQVERCRDEWVVPFLDRDDRQMIRSAPQAWPVAGDLRRYDRLHPLSVGGMRTSRGAGTVAGAGRPRHVDAPSLRMEPVITSTWQTCRTDR